ncbi:insulinase family protein [Flavobacteriaceae bacterium F08102]|nr:insulinase family protein [Flavobacteriaceae bacterium F08102]
MKTYNGLFVGLFISLSILSCKEHTGQLAQETNREKEQFSVDFEKFQLDNGLKVIFHIDRSDPVVAVALTSHVGSAREIEGRTGFAHLFEHLLFLESENLGKGGLDKMSARIGGAGANGSTNRDRTNYYQTVPKDALEKMIWAEADKLGYFINTVTEPVLAKEKEVVKNEKRQRVDNQPYGHVDFVVNKNLYPKGHPYSWTVIGSLEDLQKATLTDVKNFYKKWYVPNNVTLTISGDFDPEQAKIWVKKYFDEIEGGDEIPATPKQLVSLDETKDLYYEDNFARLPQLTLTWPSVYEFHDDSYALNVLTTYLSEGKKAPLYQTLVVDKQLTDYVDFYNATSELAGELSLSLVTFKDVALNDALEGVMEAFADFEKNGMQQADLDRIKAGQETRFYASLASAEGKGFQLAQYEIFAGDPGYISEDIQKIRSVNTEDVMRVYRKYLKGKNYVSVSAVPRGQTKLAITGARKANVVEEKIVEGAEANFDPNVVATYDKTPSSFDRSIEPPYGETPVVKAPEVWKDELNSGIKIYGITNDEVPLVQFKMQIKGGMLLENSGKIGVSNLLASLMTRGTEDKTPEEFENAIESLGASISARASTGHIEISGMSLSKNYDATMQLITEMILKPRWDQQEFDLVKQSTLNNIIQIQSNPNSIATNEFAKIVYGSDHLLANRYIGTANSVEAITLSDLKAYYEAHISPSVTKFQIVGDITIDKVKTSLAVLNNQWTPKSIEFPTLKDPLPIQSSKVYFYDVPDAKQSVITFGYPSLKATDPDYYAANVLNYRLGGGGFAAQLTQELRESKGYTYGIRSSFSGDDIEGMFTISSGIRTNVTSEASVLIKEILENYGPNFSEKDLEVTKGYLVKSNARAFETMGAKLGMLNSISHYNYPNDYAAKRVEQVQAMTLEDMKELAKKYIHPDKMIYLVVGDAKTQLNKMKQLGFGEAILLNP